MMGNDSGNQPEIHKEQFTCPHCKVLAKQDWADIRQIAGIVNYTIENIYMEYRVNIGSYDQERISKFITHLFQELPRNLPANLFPQDFSFARCQSCSKMSVWMEQDKEDDLSKIIFFPRSQCRHG